jgi:signal peptidase I
MGSHDDRVLVNRLAYRFGSPKRGQIIVFKAPPASASCAGERVQILVKRLIGLPGEQVSERNGYVFIDGKRLAEPYVDPSLRDHGTQTWSRVPDSRYFFLGDDRAHSCDSRTWGTVRRGSLIGRVLVTYWPPSRVAIH